MFTEVVLPLLIIGLCVLVSVLLIIARRRRRRRNPPVVSEAETKTLLIWSEQHGDQVDDWVTDIDRRLVRLAEADAAADAAGALVAERGDTADAAFDAAVAACPDEALRDDLNRAREAALAMLQRAADGEPNEAARELSAYRRHRDQAAARMEEVAPDSVVG